MSLRSPFLPLTSTSRRDLVERLVQLVLGLFVYGVALAMMVRAAVGVAPWDVLSLGLVNHLPIGFGAATVAISFVVLLLWIPLRQRLGIGTVANALLIGPSADVAMHVIPPAANVWFGAAMFLAGLVVLAFATAVYIGADFGPGPRDGLMTGIVRVSGWPIWVARTLIEGSVLLIGWLLGGPVGLGTVAFAFGVGPLIQRFLPPVARWRARRSAALATPGAAC